MKRTINTLSTAAFFVIVIASLILFWRNIDAIESGLAAGLHFAGYVLAIAAVIGLGFGAVLLFRFVYGSIEDDKLGRAKRRIENAKLATVFTTYSANEELVITNLIGDTRALHTMPQRALSSHVNGEPARPDPLELMLWRERLQAQVLMTGRRAIPAPEPEPDAPDIVVMQTAHELLKAEPCVGIYGTRGSGKTNAAMHYLDNHSRADIYAIDPKGRRINDWPGHVQVFETVDSFVSAAANVRSILDYRRENAITTDPATLFFVDESPNLAELLDKDDFEFVLSTVWYCVQLGREYKVHAGLTAFGTTVAALGIAGRHYLKENLALLRLTGNAGAGSAKAFVSIAGGDEIEVLPYPRYFPDKKRLPAKSADDLNAERARRLYAQIGTIAGAARAYYQIDDVSGWHRTEFKRLAGVS